MCQSSMNTGSEYAQYFANTGIEVISDADADLSGNNAVTIFTAGEEGSIIKSIVIKAQQAVIQGMVRIFIANSDSSVIALYKEVLIPIFPQAASVPIPTPIFTMFETRLVGDLKLESGYSILASTQNRQAFSIIVEGLDWTYNVNPQNPVCCNIKETIANTGIGIISIANSNLNGQGVIVPIITANENGTFVKNITVKALQSTQPGAIRLFISAGGNKWVLIQEISVPQTTQSSSEPSYKQVIDINFNLQKGYQFGATTQNAESFAITMEGGDWSYAF
jgi:hypothetical protein